MNTSQLARLAAGIVAAVLFVIAAQSMDIHSQAGTSIDEAFYQAMGMFSYAMAALSITVAWPVNTVRGETTTGHATGTASAPPTSALNSTPD
jgi:hypothetical protein